jgi:hypothetical protein
VTRSPSISRFSIEVLETSPQESHIIGCRSLTGRILDLEVPISTEKDDLEKILENHAPVVRSLVDSLQRIVKGAAPNLSEEVKTGWGNIVYKQNGVVCAISPHRQHVNLYFYKGASLSDSEGLLEGTGKALRHVKIFKPEDIREEALTQLIQEAVRLDNN